MSLNLAQLKTDLAAAYDATLVADTDAATAKTDFVNAMATAIDNYVKTATIVYTGGLVAGANVVAGTFGGDLQ